MIQHHQTKVVPGYGKAVWRLQHLPVLRWALMDCWVLFYPLGTERLAELSSRSWCLGSSPKSVACYPREKPHKMDSIRNLIKLLKQLDLINIVSPESPTSCSLLLVQTSILQSGNMSAPLPVPWGCLGAHVFPTSWSGACSPHPNMEGFPWQLMHLWMDLWLNGTDLTYSRAQWDSINPFTFPISCGFILWLATKCSFYLLWPILRSSASVLATRHPAVKSQHWWAPCSKDILVKKSTTGRNQELDVLYSIMHRFLDT